MAQAIADPNDIRHGFSFNVSSSYNFGSISGMAATRLGNILVCDHVEDKLVLLDESCNYMRHRSIQGKPWDVAISDNNTALVTFPEEKLLKNYDPETLIWNKEFSRNRPYGVSNIRGSETFVESRVNLELRSSLLEVSSNIYTWVPDLNVKIDKHVRKVFAGKCANRRVGERWFLFYCCSNDSVGYKVRDFEGSLESPSDQNIYGINNKEIKIVNKEADVIKLPTLKVPSDVTCDDNGHVYVSGQYSNNIVRLTEEAKVIDIPLNDQHGIKRPTAMCFNRDYTKFYVANDHGKKVLCFDVV